MIGLTGEKQLSRPGTVILIPACNEAEVITEIHAACDFKILGIDDVSTDDTVARARQAGATVIPLAIHLGAWGATQTGLRYALRNNYDIAIIMDADGQHEDRHLKTLIEPVAQDMADVAIGACSQRGSILRKIAWMMMEQASGLSLEDITSGFRVYNRKAIRKLAAWQATLLDYQAIGVLLLLQAQNTTIVDIEVTMLPRSNGKSRIFYSWGMVMYYMCHTLLLGLSKRKLTRLYRDKQLMSSKR